MSISYINDIILLNKDFYKKVDKDFSRTRQGPWSGWDRVGEVVKRKFYDKERLRVLDIGCGNGRYCDFLHSNLKDIEIEYTGLDSNEFLLKEAKEKYTNARFIHYDVIKDLKDLEGQYDLVVAFGITHHIPSKEFRKKWFKDLAHLASSGLLIFTTWNYDIDERFMKKAVKEFQTKDFSFKESDLEEGDYFLGWAESPDTYRYVHLYNEKEIDEIINLLKESKLELVERFSSDGRGVANLNNYFVFEK